MVELATPGSAVRHASVARHVTDACLTAEPTQCDKAYTGDNPHLMHQSFVSTAPLMHQSFVSTAPLMHQSFVSTAPSPTGMGGDSDFSLFRVLWGQADGNNPTLSPALNYRKSHRGKCPNVKTPAVPRYCGDNRKVLA